MSKIAKFFGSSHGSSSSGSSSSSKSKHHQRSKGGPTPQEAIHRLRETEEMLTKKQDYLEKKIEQELMVARKHGTKNKKAALAALKRKKRFEAQLTQIDGTLSTIEFQREALENSHTNTEVLNTLSFASNALKKVHDHMDINKIDDMIQDITEQQDVAREISEAISMPFGDTFDEDELMAELRELEEEGMEESMASMGGLPSVPSSKLPAAPHAHHTTTKKRVEEEDDMHMLASWGT